MPKQYADMTAEELRAERDKLAAERTRIRLAQNEVGALLAAKEAIEGLPPEVQKLITINVGGAIAPEGAVN